MKSLYFLILIGITFDGFAADSEIDAVKKVLSTPRRDWSKWPWQEHAEDLKPLGDKAIPLLATLLGDGSFAYDAFQTMLVIDPNKAAPLIFASMPKSDSVIQVHAFKFFISRIHEGVKLPFVSAIHDAAVRCLSRRAVGEEGEPELIAIGLTGSDADFPLLERFYNNKDETEYWRLKLQNAAESALARLGHPKYLKNIEDELAKPVPSPMRGDRAYPLEEAIFKAGFSQNPRFIPLLASHLDDPPPEIPVSDVKGPYPAGAAAVALDQIVNRTSPELWSTEIDWKKWWNENKHKFSK